MGKGEWRLPRRFPAATVLALAACLSVAPSPAGEPPERDAGRRSGSPSPSLTPPPATRSSAETEAKLEGIRSLLRDGKYQEAEPQARLLLEEIEAEEGADSVTVARVLDLLSDTLSRLGRAQDPETRSLAERALRIKESALAPGDPEIATSLVNLSVLLYRAGDLAGARAHADRALDINERASGPLHRDVAKVLNLIALIHRELGDYDAAALHFERALRTMEEVLGPEDPEVVKILNNLGGVFKAKGDYAKARPLFERGLAVRERILPPNHPDLANSLTTLGNLLNETGDLFEARPLLERALQIRRAALGMEHPDVAAALNNLAVLRFNMGDYAVAKSLYEQALEIRERALGPEHRELAEALYNLGDTRSALGDLDGVVPLYERAIGILEASVGPRHHRLAEALTNLADVVLQRGDPARALPLYERALEIWETALGKESPFVALGLRKIALLRLRSGDHAAARPLLERALALREEAFGAGAPAVAESLSDLAELRREEGDFETARSLHERSLRIREDVLGPDHPDVGSCLRDLARLELASGNVAHAMESSLRAESILRRHFQKNSRYLSEREALQLESLRASTLDVALTILAGRWAGDLSPDTASRVWEEIVASRALILDEVGRRHRTSLASGDAEARARAAALESARAKLARLVVRGPDERFPERYRDLVRAAEAEKERIERSLAELMAGSPGFGPGRPVRVADMARRLPPDAALVAFARFDRLAVHGRDPGVASTSSKDGSSEPSYVAFTMRGGGAAPAVIALGSAVEIDSLVHGWRREASTAPAHPMSDESYRDAGAALRRAIWEPLQPILKGARRVLIVPEGSLHLVNVAALPLEGNGYLAESGPTLHYLSAERDLLDPEDAGERGLGLLLLGGPDFDARPRRPAEAPPPVLKASSASGAPDPSGLRDVYRGSHSTCGGFRSLRFGPLPSASGEADEVESLWRASGGVRGQGDQAVVKLAGASAGEHLFKRNAPGKRVLHLATHAFFVQDECAPAGDGAQEGSAGRAPRADPVVPVENPLLLSGLALAGANLRDEPAASPDAEDGVLTAEEVASLDLRGVEWVVLSACGTGMGPVQSGEGVLGLRRAFEVAGARTLIMSLWAVGDHAARVWMRHLYESRLAGATTSEAAREASLAMITARRRAGVSTHPYFWGAFVAAGDWR